MNENENMFGANEQGDINKQLLTNDIQEKNIMNESENMFGANTLDNNDNQGMNLISTIKNTNMGKFAKLVYSDEKLEKEGIILKPDGEIFSGEGKSHYDEIAFDVCKNMLGAGQINLLMSMNCIMTDGNYSVFATFTDDGGGKRSIGFRLVYENSISELIKIRQADFFKMISYMKFKYDNKTDKPKKITVEERLYIKFSDTIADYQRVDVPLDVDKIINAIYKNYNVIPQARTATDIEDFVEVYSKLRDYMERNIKSSTKYCISSIRKDDMYYKILSEDFVAIAENVKMTEVKLARYLADRGMIHIPSYSLGYQTKVYFENGGESAKRWVYCVLKPDYFTKELKNDMGMDETGKCK